jgi:phosphoesterase RecJ-like protein
VIGDAGHRLFEKVVGSHDAVVLTTHMHPDGDALGSQLGLAAYLIDRGVTVTILNPDPVADNLAFIVDSRHQVLTFDPERHGETLREASRIILLDNSAPDRLGSMEAAMLENTERVLCIDHHPSRQPPWADMILDQESSATAAMIHELVTRQGWTPDPAAARALFVGLSTDTGFFRFNSTNAEAHRIAAELLEIGVDTAATFQAVHERNSVAYTRLLGRALSDLRLDAGGSVVSVRISGSDQDRSDACGVDTSEMTTPLLAIEGVRIALLFRELDGGEVKVSLRSKGDINVHALAMKFGGGGHFNASGIVMAGDLADVVERIIGEAVQLT